MGAFSISTLVNLRLSDPNCNLCFAVFTAFQMLPPQWVQNYHLSQHLISEHRPIRWGLTPDNVLIQYCKPGSLLLTKTCRNLYSLDSDWHRAKYGFLLTDPIDLPTNPFHMPKYYTPYQKSFQFKVLHKAITTRAKLSFYKIIPEDASICVHCQESEDDFYHGLVTCPGSRNTWASLQTILDESSLTHPLNVSAFFSVCPSLRQGD